MQVRHAPSPNSRGLQVIKIKETRPFRLLYDLRWMELGRAGGIEQATHELLAAIGGIDRTNRFRVFGPRSACHEWDFSPGFKVDLHYSDAGVRLDGLDFDIVHSVCGYTHPDLLDRPGVLTMNDLQHLQYPENFTPADWNDRERLYRQSAAAARHIICISEFTRQDVHRRYGIPLEKMSTIWIIPSRSAWEPVAEGEQARLLDNLGVTEPFLLFPAHCWPHKNHARLVQAFDRVRADLPGRLKLIFTGRPFPSDHPAAMLIRERRLADRVVHLGYRTALEMRALFQGCQALVFPSLFEGFGMPVAEAIIAGRPVLCSNVTALPEVAGDAAYTFDPHDVADIAAKLLEISTRPELREMLANAALRRRARFSSRLSAVQTLAVYQRVFAEMPGTSP